jgi:DNA polymerase III epsilon subunit family exonuclease
MDVETTGLSADSGDRVCEIGAVKLRGGAVIKTFGTLIDPERPISAGAYAVNGISPSMLAGAPIFPDVSDKLRTMMDGCILVAYNAPFDLSFIRSEFQMAGDPGVKNMVVDALALARQLLPGLGRYPQENVARVLGISSAVKHRALEDALVTSQIFAIFLSILKAYNCTSIEDLSRRDIAQIVHLKRMEIVETALKNRSDIWLKYLSSTNGEISDRIVTPRDCISDGFGKNRFTYLTGYCHNAELERNFRIDRILDIRII